MNLRGFGPRARSAFRGFSKIDAGCFGDLRLLALSVAILAVCLLLVILRPGKSSENRARPASEAVEALAPVEQQADGAPFDAQAPEVAAVDGYAAWAPTPALPSEEEQEQALREMAEQMTPGEVIIY